MHLQRRTLASSADDPFKDFREIALLEISQQFNYRHSFGKVSRFFFELANGKLFATRCKACGRVYMPPRAVCPDDLKVTEWLELSGHGRLVSWTLCQRAPAYAKTTAPYLLAYVRLDGTESLFLNQLKNVSVNEIEHQLEVKTVFAEHAGHPLERMWFEPV